MVIMSSKNRVGLKGFYIFFTIILAVSLFAYKDKIRNYFSDDYQDDTVRESSDTQPNLSKQDVENIVKSFIESNSGFILQTLEDYQIKKMQEFEEQSKAKINDFKPSIENMSMNPYSGNQDAKIIIISFFDYNCGYCKMMDKIFDQLVSKDNDIKVIYRELPILGEVSKNFSSAALAVYLIDNTKYVAFHRAAMSIDKPSDKDIEKIIKSLGIDINLFQNTLKNAKINEELDKIKSLSSEMGVTATPSFLIGNELVRGAINLESIEEIIKNIRSDNQKNGEVDPASGSIMKKEEDKQ